MAATRRQIMIQKQMLAKEIWLKKKKKKNPVSTITYAEDSNESINGWNLETCNTCKVPRSEEGDIEQNHLNITREVWETVTFWFHNHVE